VTMLHHVRDSRARLSRVFRTQEAKAYGLELDGSILIWRKAASDHSALQHLAALASRELPDGWFLLAEVGGELVAAAPLDVDEELLNDPFRPTANFRELRRLTPVRE
jgi:hypothetical protein